MHEGLTPWERAFFERPGEPRGYQPAGPEADHERPPVPPSGSAGASRRTEEAASEGGTGHGEG
jgi:hypothetical protein